MTLDKLIGRDDELKTLVALKSKRTASLVVLWGRRRIGKSTLAQLFGSSFPKFFQFQGLGPREKQKNQDQLNYFAERLQDYFGLPQMKLRSWSEAFTVLASQCQTGSVCILLDEISWLGGKDKDFSGRLKIAWDTQFKGNPKLVLIVCGSVSAWIQKNILSQTDFVGRISLAIQLKELSLSEVNNFWSRKSLNIGLAEMFNALLLTGGVPKYAEEMAEKTPIAKQIQRKCFTQSGFFFQEFDRVFSDIFGRRSHSLKPLVKALSTRRMAAATLARLLGKPLNGKFLESIDHLVLSGFVERERIQLISGEESSKTLYRLKDNYLRFYIRLIDPRKRAIEQDQLRALSVESLPGWDSFCGQQFENLIYSSLSQVYALLGIDTVKIISAGPYQQTKSSRNKSSCQVDLMIHEKRSNYYICEIKSGEVSAQVTKEVERKIEAIKFPKVSSIRPVLICAFIDNKTRDNLADSFYKIITLEELLR